MELINGKYENFLFAYDAVNNILHLRDKDNHDEMSLINSIDSSFAHSVIREIEGDYTVSVDTDSLRCFIYTDGGDGFANEVDEYVFKHEEGVGKCLGALVPGKQQKCISAGEDSGQIIVVLV